MSHVLRRLQSPSTRKGLFFHSPIDTNPLVSTTIQFAVTSTCVVEINSYNNALVMIKARVLFCEFIVIIETPLSIICNVSHDEKLQFQSKRRRL